MPCSRQSSSDWKRSGWISGVWVMASDQSVHLMLRPPGARSVVAIAQHRHALDLCAQPWPRRRRQSPPSGSPNRRRGCRLGGTWTSSRASSEPDSPAPTIKQPPLKVGLAEDRGIERPARPARWRWPARQRGRPTRERRESAACRRGWPGRQAPSARAARPLFQALWLAVGREGQVVAVKKGGPYQPQDG